MDTKKIPEKIFINEDFMRGCFFDSPSQPGSGKDVSYIRADIVAEREYILLDSLKEMLSAYRRYHGMSREICLAQDRARAAIAKMEG